jgi:hypothetical protein
MKHYINGIEITPRNNFDIGIKVDFSARADQNNISVDNVILVNQAKKLVSDHLLNIGIYEGQLYDVRLGDNVKLNFFIDFSDSLTIKDKEIEVKLKKRLSHDNFFDNAQALTFDYLNTQIKINEYEVGYQINPVDPEGQAMFISLCIYSVTMTLMSQANEVKKSIIEISTASGFGALLRAVLNTALRIAYFSLLVYEALKLVKKLVELVYPKVRYFKASKVLDLCQKGCKYLGYSFKSSILEGEYKDLAVIPVPINKTSKKWFEVFKDELSVLQTAHPQATDTTQTLGVLLSSLESMFNAKIRVVNGIVQMERWDYWFNQSVYKFNSSLALQSEAQDSYSYDFSRNFNAYLIQFQTDYADTTTIDYFDRSNTEYNCRKTNDANPDLNLTKGLIDINIPFSRAIAKNKFTWLEKRFESMFKAIDKVSKSNSGSKKSKIGLMQISQQFFSVTKMLILNTGGKKIADNDQSLLSAESLWNKFHSINQPQKYRFIIKNGVKIPLNDVYFNQLLNNNYAIIDGKQSEILNMEYFDEKGYAIIDYKQPDSTIKPNVKVVKVF